MEYSYLRSNVDLDIPYTTLPDLLKRRADETPDKAFVLPSVMTMNDTLLHLGNFTTRLLILQEL